MKSIRVFIADDHELVRMALKTLLDGESDLEVVGEAADTETAVAGVVEMTPDVLLLDLRMPGGGGVEVCRRVKELLPDTRVLVITSFDDDEELVPIPQLLAELVHRAPASELHVHVGQPEDDLTALSRGDEEDSRRVIASP